MTRFEDLLKETIGLDVASVGRPMIEHAVRSRMAACGIGTHDEYWLHLSTSEPERNELIERVVVPETSFFRDREAFAALANIARENGCRCTPGADGGF